MARLTNAREGALGRNLLFKESELESAIPSKLDVVNLRLT